MTSQDRTKKQPWIPCQVGDDSVSQDSVQENKNNLAITQLGYSDPMSKIRLETRTPQVSPVSLYIRNQYRTVLKVAILDSLGKKGKKNKENGKRNN